MKKFISFAATAMLLAALPLSAMAAGFVGPGTGPSTGGGGLQNENLTVQVPVSLTLTGACTALYADAAVAFNTITPSNAGSGGSTNFNVYPTCGAGVPYNLTFTSANAAAAPGPCYLQGPGTNKINYDVYYINNIVAGAGLCQGNGGNGTLNPSHADTGTGAQQTIGFQAQIAQLVNGNQPIPASGQYGDNLNIYLVF